MDQNDVKRSIKILNTFIQAFTPFFESDWVLWEKYYSMAGDITFDCNEELFRKIWFFVYLSLEQSEPLCGLVIKCCPSAAKYQNVQIYKVNISSKQWLQNAAVLQNAKYGNGIKSQNLRRMKIQIIMQVNNFIEGNHHLDWIWWISGWGEV